MTTDPEDSKTTDRDRTTGEDWDPDSVRGLNKGLRRAIEKKRKGKRESERNGEGKE